MVEVEVVVGVVVVVAVEVEVVVVVAVEVEVVVGVVVEVGVEITNKQQRKNMKDWKKELTVSEALEIAASFRVEPMENAHVGHPYPLQTPIEIRTVTHYYAGKIINVYAHEIVMISASWIADEGRFTQAQATGDFAETEVLPPDRQLIIGRGSIVSANVIPKLPTEQK